MDKNLVNKRVAVYAGTRNLYKNMIIAAHSLLYHSNIEKVFFLIEDDIFPYELPREIECINVSNQTFFSSNGPNFNSSWTYMVLIRAALSKIFPEYDTILSLDVDTIVNENINELWNYNLENYYIAAVKEDDKSTDNFLYINMGVALLNLKKLRDDHKDDEIIAALNNKFYQYNEQDCINELCQGYILELPADYNINNYTYNALHRKIIHFAAIKNWHNLPLVNWYKEDLGIRNKSDSYGLDIIIPTYKNIEALKLTLNSFYCDEIFKWAEKYNFPISITIVDDASELDYSEVQKEFPCVQFIFQSSNSGPGVARQIGLEYTYNPYILFIDTGDYLLSKYAILQIILTIQSTTIPYIYLWRWLNEENHKYSDNGSTLLHGAVYNREFLDIYGIKFCAESSYSNEDVGFNRACRLIFNQLDLFDSTKKIQFFKTPIYMYTYDKNSITHKNNKEFMYTKQLQGLILNTYHVIKIGEKNNIDKIFLWYEVSEIMVRLYYDFLVIMKKNPSFGQEAWTLLQQYYNDLYCKYQMNDELALQAAKSAYIKDIIKLGTQYINVFRFLHDLQNEKIIPEYYY